MFFSLVVKYKCILYTYRRKKLLVQLLSRTLSLSSLSLDTKLISSPTPFGRKFKYSNLYTLFFDPCSQLVLTSARSI